MYRRTESGGIQRIEDGAFIPEDEMNADYRDYLHWTSEGNEPEPYEPPPPPPEVVPDAVTMRQARLALLGAGKLADVEAAINSLPSPMKEQARISWDYSSQVHRSHGIVAQMGPALGLSETDIDNLFKVAVKL